MARTNTLGNFLTDVADAIRTKKGSSGTIQASSFDSEILSIPSGGTTVESNDVNFYDYDGTLLYSYSKADFLELTEMPSNPSHEGLTAQGWNWTLSEAQTFLADKSYVDIGQVYEPTDGKTKIYVSLTGATLNPTLSIIVVGTVTIDWGDNSTPDTVTGTDTTTVIDTTHTYSSDGDYVITLDSNTTIYVPGGDNTYGSKFFWKGGTLDYSNQTYLFAINKVIFGNNVSLSKGTLRSCKNLKSVVLPNNVTTSMGTSFFADCVTLKHITIPKTAGYVLGSYFVNRCYNLKSVSLSSTTTKLNQDCFDLCYILERICLPNSITTLSSYLFGDCNFEKIEISNNVSQIRGFSGLYLLKSVTINQDCYFSNGSFTNCYSIVEFNVLGNITSIGSSIFTNNYSCLKYDFTGCTAVPTLSNANAFSNINPNCKIIVPDSLYNDWISANNWSTYSSYIVKESSV